MTHLHLDAQLHVESAAVIVEEALGLVAAVRHACDDGARGALGVVPDPAMRPSTVSRP